MRFDDQVFSIQRSYPQLWHACHVKHRRGATSDDGPSERDAALLAHLEPSHGTRAGTLARHLDVSPSTLSEALEDLERHGYVERRRRAGDRRVVEVHLTEKGREVVARRSALDGDRLAELLRRLSPAERREAVRGLERLASAARALRTGRAS
ncbi:MAG: MarR family winged helix-turn-helix transcriptional regulator [Myxococcota bacterium]